VATAKKAAPAKEAPAKAAAKKAPAKKAVAKKNAPAKKDAPAKKAAPAAKKAAAPAKKAAAPAKKAAPAAKTAADPAKQVAPPSKKVPPPVPAKAAAPALKGPVAKPVVKRGGKVVLDKWQLKQKELLLAEKGEYLEQAKLLREEADELMRDAEPGDVQFDDESGEGGSLAIERERDLALALQAVGITEEIDDALRKLERGLYGQCETCGKDILKARLEALPYARQCIACKTGGLSRR
jgi:RNA polymerase-binding transcription factor DksA